MWFTVNNILPMYNFIGLHDNNNLETKIYKQELFLNYQKFEVEMGRTRSQVPNILIIIATYCHSGLL